MQGQHCYVEDLAIESQPMDKDDLRGAHVIIGQLLSVKARQQAVVDLSLIS
jgi:hypothetical protein